MRYDVPFTACSRGNLSIELHLSQQCLVELQTENPKEMRVMPKIMTKSFSSYFQRRYLLLPWYDNKAVTDLSQQLAPERTLLTCVFA